MKEPQNMSEHPVFVDHRQKFKDVIDTVEPISFEGVPFTEFCDMQSWATTSQALNINISQAPTVFMKVAGASVTLERDFKIWAKQNPEAAKELLS